MLLTLEKTQAVYPCSFVFNRMSKIIATCLKRVVKYRVVPELDGFMLLEICFTGLGEM